MDYRAKNVVTEKVVQAAPPGGKQPGDQGICAAVRDGDIGRTEGALRRAAKRLAGSEDGAWGPQAERQVYRPAAAKLLPNRQGHVRRGWRRGWGYLHHDEA